MKNLLRKKMLLSGGLFILLMTAVMALAPKANACPNVTLSSPPTTLEMCNHTCNTPALCNRSCENTLTLSFASEPCGPFTWTFTNNTTGCVTVFVTSGASPTLNFFLCGSAGNSISLVISTAGSTSPTYNFTGVACS